MACHLLRQHVRSQVRGRVHDDPAAVQERHPQFVDRGVEGQRRVQQHPFMGAAVPSPVRRQAHHIAVGDSDPLGGTGRSGCVDHVCEPGRVLAAVLRCAVALVQHFQLVQHHGGAGTGQVLRRAGRGQQEYRPRVAQHELDPLGRVVGIHGQIGGTCLQHSQHSHDRLGGPRQRDRDDRFRPHAAQDQAVRQPLGSGVEFFIGQRDVAGHHRDRVRGQPDLPLEQRRNGRVVDPFGRFVHHRQQPVPPQRIMHIHHPTRTSGSENRFTSPCCPRHQLPDRKKSLVVPPMKFRGASSNPRTSHTFIPAGCWVKQGEPTRTPWPRRHGVPSTGHLNPFTVWRAGLCPFGLFEFTPEADGHRP